MNICLIGNSLTTLALAKNLINKEINVFAYMKKNINLINDSRTIGISKNNYDFINQDIIKLKKNLIWKIKQIEIYNEKSNDEKIFNFRKSEEELFVTLKNNQLYSLLSNELKNNKLFKKILIKKDNFYEKLVKEKKYDLIINCDANNQISKKFFNKKINKNYNSYAYTTIIEHDYIENFKAVQIFTKTGPIAFLPISNIKTSVVFSKIKEKNMLSENAIINLIKSYNKFYKIKNFSKVEKFDLQFSLSKNYYNKDFMLFGDNLHKIHPLAGQGFNMTLRDIRFLSKIIQERIDLGLELDQSIYEEFENKTKHLNFIFSIGIDFIYEFFKLDHKYKNKYPIQLLKLLGKNKLFNKYASDYADNGLVI